LLASAFEAGFWLHKTCFVTIHAMQSFNTESDDAATPVAAGRKVTVGAINDLRPGECARFELPGGEELAVYNVGGEFYATENFCPHKGAALSEGVLCGHVIECGLHGWQFDVRTGECLTVSDRIKTYSLKIEDGIVSVELD
jgi:nitrite reductase/ring-hydroxylating ferredoxin subunit